MNEYFVLVCCILAGLLAVVLADISPCVDTDIPVVKFIEIEG